MESPADAEHNTCAWHIDLEASFRSGSSGMHTATAACSESVIAGRSQTEVHFLTSCSTVQNGAPANICSRSKIRGSCRLSQPNPGDPTIRPTGVVVMSLESRVVRIAPSAPSKFWDLHRVPKYEHAIITLSSRCRSSLSWEDTSKRAND